MNKGFAWVFWMAVLLPCSNTVFAQKDKPLYTAALGVEAFTFRKSFPIDVARTLDTIKMMGYSEIEGGGNGMPAAVFKKLCDERGISIPSVGASYEELVKFPDSVRSKAKILG